MKQFVATFSVLLSVLMVVFSSCTKAHAQMGFSVWPPHVELELRPGEKHNAEVYIENETLQTIAIKVEAMDFAYDEKGNLELLSSEDEKDFNGCSQWICLKEASKEVAPGKTEQFQFQVKAPEKAIGGSYRTYLIFSTSSKKRDNIKIVGEIASLLKVRVQGNGDSSDTKALTVCKKGKFVSFRNPRFNFGQSVPFVLTFENLGNVRLVVNASIKIQNNNNRLVERIELPTKRIQAHERYTWSENWKPPRAIGQYTAEALIDAGLEKDFTGTKRFWVIKWQLILTIAVLVMAIVAFGLFVFTRLVITKRVEV